MPPWGSRVAVFGNTQMGKLSCQFTTVEICESKDLNGSPLMRIWCLKCPAWALARLHLSGCDKVGQVGGLGWQTSASCGVLRVPASSQSLLPMFLCSGC